MLTGKHGKISILQRLTKVFSSTFTKGNPWITKDFIKLCRKKKHLYKKAKKSNSEDFQIKTLVRPILECANLVWSPHLAKRHP